MNSSSIAPDITPEILKDHGISPEEYDKILKALGREPTPHRTRHLQRDVERALLLQVVARAPEAPAHAQPPRACRAGRERRHHRHRRRLGVRLQDRVAQSSLVHRAVPGRRHRRRRHSARHLHHGRAAGRHHGFAALWADHPAHPSPTDGTDWSIDQATLHKNHSVHGRRGQRRRLVRQLLWRAERRRRDEVRAAATRAIRW